MTLSIDNDEQMAYPFKVNTDTFEPINMVDIVIETFKTNYVSEQKASVMSDNCIQYTINCKMFSMMEEAGIDHVTKNEYDTTIIKYTNKAFIEVSILKSTWIHDYWDTLIKPSEKNNMNYWDLMIPYCELLAKDYQALQNDKNAQPQLPFAMETIIQNCTEMIQELNSKRNK